jgi:hypothetical protein
MLIFVLFIGSPISAMRTQLERFFACSAVPMGNLIQANASQNEAHRLPFSFRM